VDPKVEGLYIISYIPPGFLGQQVPFLRDLAFLSISPFAVTSISLQHLTNLQWTDSSVVIGDLLALLALAPLLEAIALDFWVFSMPGAVPSKVITLSKLRKLTWVNGGRPSFMPFPIAPELNDLEVCLAYNPTNSDPSIILPPHREHFPLLTEPTAVRYICRDFARTWHFTGTSGHLMISESPDLSIGDPPADRWLSPNAPIFREYEGAGCRRVGRLPTTLQYSD